MSRPVTAPRLAPDVAARVIALPDGLRGWAREEPLVWLHLSRHVLRGAPLTECLAAIVRAMGADALSELRERLADADRPDLAAWLAPRPVRAVDDLATELALPDDLALDVFASGDAEVDAYFRARRWFDASKGEHAPPTYTFRADDGAVVGFASVAFRRSAHPDDASAMRARYLTIYAVGVTAACQGVRNPRAPEETYAATILRVIEDLAREHDDCVGLALWVRATNARAIAFYRKVGFAADPGGAVPRDAGAPHLTMRKPLR